MFRAGDEPIPGYHLERMLGRGGFGEVWQARGPGRTAVALKFINLDGTAGLKEFRALQRVKEIRHAHLLPLHAFWVLDDRGSPLDDGVLESLDRLARTGQANAQLADRRPVTLVVAMTLADGSLSDLLASYRSQGLTGIPTGQLLEYLADVARAVDYLNTPQHDLGDGPVAVQHCDIKPQNILLLGDSAMVCDFGLARVFGDTQGSSGLAGTPAYMAPEVIEGHGVSSTTDQYSLAITYFHLRTGQLPFLRDAYIEVMAAHTKGELRLEKLSPPELQVIRRATALHPAERYPTTSEMCRRLRAAVEGLPSELPGVSAPESQALDVPTQDFRQQRTPAPAVTHAPEQDAPRLAPLAPQDSQDLDESPCASSPEAEVPGALEQWANEEQLPASMAVRMGLVGAMATMKMTGWSCVSPPHLWLGLTYISDGLLCQALTRQGHDPTTTRRALRAKLLRDKAAGDSPACDLDEAAQQALRLARRLARKAGESKIRERQLLASLLLVSDSLLERLLLESAIDIPQLIKDCRMELPAAKPDTPAEDEAPHATAPPGGEPLDVPSALLLFADDGALELTIFDADCRAALVTASELADEMGPEEIRSAHLFLGILARPGSRLAPATRQAGVGVPALIAAFRNLWRAPPGTVPPHQLHRDYLSKHALSQLRGAVAQAHHNGGRAVTERDLLSVLLHGESVITRVLAEQGLDSAKLLRHSADYLG
ncbi:MAG: protein kinase [Planctomycetota bacterium]|nr:protein kinase [Planctomycetota bacterium]